jgi:CO/xanthine dehydrogenase Mo-binding subunit
MDYYNHKTDKGTTGQTTIGGETRRIDSLGKVTGATCYVEDMVLPGMLYASVLRSPHHFARLVSIDITEAEQSPGVVRVFTASDIPGVNELVGYSQGEPVLTPVGDTVRQQGAPVALIVAETLDQARQGRQSIKVEYEVLPPVFGEDGALNEDAEPLYPGGNILNTHHLKHGDLQATFEGSDILVETDYFTAFQEHSALEREAALGYIDEAGRITVVAGTHEPHWQQGYIAQTLGIDAAKIRVIVPPTGGSFGGKQDPWPFCVTGLMVHLLGRPVRLIYSRGEVFSATPKRHAYHLNLKIGAMASGRFTGIRVRINADTGGYDSAGYWIPAYAVTASGGAYSWQAVDAFAQSYFTNAAKCGQFRGFGTPQSVFALESTLDELAQKLNIDALELRLKNHLPQDGISFLGHPVGESLGYVQVLEAIRPRYQEFLSEMQDYNAKNNGAHRMGVGLAGMWYRFGKSGSLQVETHAELASDGHFVIYCSAPDYGQGITTVMVQLAAEALGVHRDCIELVNADTGCTPDSGIQGASRATYFIGSSVSNSASNLKEAILSTASEMLDLNPADLALSANVVYSRSDPARSVTLAAVAAEFDLLGKSRRIVGMFDLGSQFPDETRPEYLPIFVTGAQLAQVVVDMETGLVEVKRLVAAHDVGRAINPDGSIGQIQGAAIMGLGSALLEEFIPGKSSGFENYILPMVHAIPDMEVILVEVPSYYGPHGAKGLGEAAMLPTAPAIINAVSRAIGCRIRQIPATPERVLQAIKASIGLDKTR